MTDGDDETPADEESGADETGDVTAEDLETRLDEAENAIDAAETEADLDDVEETLDAVEADLESADLPEPEEDDEADPREELESRLADLRDALDDARGPYAEDVVDVLDEAATTLAETEWTETGEDEIVDAVEAFADDVAETLDGSFAPDGRDVEALVDAVDAVADAVSDAALDPDEDADDVAALLDAADGLVDGLDAAEEWDDLETHVQLRAQGYYDVLGHYKDFPPEWAALKEWEKRGNVEMVLLALDSLQSDFMERHCLEALARMNDDAAFEAMHQRAGKRDKPGIEVLGKMAAEDAVETLVEYVDADSDPQLQKVTFKALGEIGSKEATQALADKLVMDNDQVRPYAARALGLIGDTRAVDPLADALADDESDRVRAAAAWALRQIGTERALEAAAEYEDDPSFLVQNEAERAADALAVAQAA
ncbi:HEAT repeat domain-containing protein [Salinirarus marinus]